MPESRPTAKPISATGTGWAGAYTDLADESDATYMESSLPPNAAAPLVAVMEALSDPGVNTGHVVTVRVQATEAGVLSALVELLDGSDDSVIASTTASGIGATAQDVTLTLTAEQAALVNYASSKVRVTAYSAAVVAFVWDDVIGATSYVLQVGTATTLSDRFNQNVGDVLTYSLALTPGTYYSRVVPQGAGSTTDEWTVTV